MMKFYRGPSSKPFYDDAHEYVSSITPEQLHKGIKDNALIRFNISKDAIERQSVCTAQFEESDIIPMIDGLIHRLKLNQQCIAFIREAVANDQLTEAQKLELIEEALDKFRK